MTDITKIEQDWLEQQQDKDLAKLCLLYVRAVNLLDIKVPADSLSPEVTYTSQSKKIVFLNTQMFVVMAAIFIIGAIQLPKFNIEFVL